jgi:hypothetical protein
MTEYRVETFHVSKDKKVKLQASAGKVTLILLWDCNGLILEHYVEPTTTLITAASYTKIFKSMLKPVTRNQRHSSLTKGVLLLHNNIRWHSATSTIEAIKQLKTELFLFPHIFWI